MNFTLSDQLMLAYIVIGVIMFIIFIVAKNAQQNNK